MVPSFRRATVKGQKGIAVVSKTKRQSSFTLFTDLYSLDVLSHIQWQYIQNVLWTSDGLLVNLSFKRSKEQLSTSLQFLKVSVTFIIYVHIFSLHSSHMTHLCDFLTFFSWKLWVCCDEWKQMNVSMPLWKCSWRKDGRRQWYTYPCHHTELHYFSLHC